MNIFLYHSGMMTGDNGYRVDPGKLTADTRWLAARRLAAGDDLHLAAARAGLHEDQLAWMQETDPGFAKLIEAARQIQDMSGAGRRATEASMAVAALEDQLVLGNTSVLNNALKGMGHYREDREPEELPYVAHKAMLMSTLSDEELAEYLWISVRNGIPPDKRHDMPFTPPGDFADRIKILASKLEQAGILCERVANDDAPPALLDLDGAAY